MLLETLAEVQQGAETIVTIIILITIIIFVLWLMSLCAILTIKNVILKMIKLQETEVLLLNEISEKLDKKE